MPGFRSGAGRFGLPAVRDGRFFGSDFGFSERFSRFANPYFSRYYGGYPFIYPFAGDFGFLWDYPPAYPMSAGYPPINNSITLGPDAPATAPEPAQPAHAVVKDYKWNESETSPTDQSATFTVALKDGSKRYAVTAWVQDNQLHYLDSGGHQRVLPAEVIDRETTEHLNRQNHLDLQLPPG